MEEVAPSLHVHVRAGTSHDKICERCIVYWHPGKTGRTGRMMTDDAMIDGFKQGKGLQSAAASQAPIVITSVNNEYSLIFYEI